MHNVLHCSTCETLCLAYFGKLKTSQAQCCVVWGPEHDLERTPWPRRSLDKVGQMGGSSRLFACGKVHRARVAVCAARAPGVDHFAPAPHSDRGTDADSGVHRTSSQAQHCASGTVVHISSCSNRSSHRRWSTSSQLLP